MLNRNQMMNQFRIFFLLTTLTAIFIGLGLYLGGTTGMIIGLIFAGIMNFGSYWYSDKIVLKMHNAEEMSEEQYPEYHKMLEQLSDRADIPKPKLYKNDMQVPNAFATGRNPEKGVVCLTEGLMNQLEMDEIEGVVAHELAHIKNRDTLINATVATMAGALAVMARIVFYSAMFSGGRDRGQAFASLAFMILVPIIAVFIKSAVSRSMEYRADSEAVRIHGDKEGLSSALRKISSMNEKSGYKASEVKETTSNLFIYNPFSGDKLTRYFSTHPSLDKRLDNIESTEL